MSLQDNLGVLISINPPYTEMILSGEKPMEFRRQVLSRMIKNREGLDILYIYETKRCGGVGKIIGEAKFHKVYPVYFDHAKYDLSIPARDACVKDLFAFWFRRSQGGLSERESKIRIEDEPWWTMSRFTEYRSWIGWGIDERFNYAIGLESVKQYDEPLFLSDFRNVDGKSLVRPPQNMQYVLKREDI